MVDNSSILEESEIAIIVNDVNRRYWISIIFLTYFDIFISKNIITIEVDFRTSFEHILFLFDPVTTKFTRIDTNGEFSGPTRLSEVFRYNFKIFTF